MRCVYIGPKGPPGAPGATGVQGESGATGLTGAPGNFGSRGPPGPPGSSSQPGPPGRQGLRGQPGRTGVRGKKLANHCTRCLPLYGLHFAKMAAQYRNKPIQSTKYAKKSSYAETEMQCYSLKSIKGINIGEFIIANFLRNLWFVNVTEQCV